MRFQTAHDGPDDLGAPIEDVAQEAIEAAALTYASDAGIDVEEHLRAQLSSRGLAAADESTIPEVAEAIRAGHSPSVGWSDGSVTDTGP